jgi:hypothetical protein
MFRGLQVNTSEEAERTASAVMTSVASTYRLWAHKLTLSDMINEPSGLDHFLHLKRRLRKLWHETRDPSCKTALNWVTKTIHKIVRTATCSWRVSFAMSFRLQAGRRNWWPAPTPDRNNVTSPLYCWQAANEHGCYWSSVALRSEGSLHSWHLSDGLAFCLICFIWSHARDYSVYVLNCSPVITNDPAWNIYMFCTQLA